MALQIGASKEMLDKSIAALRAIFDAPDYQAWALGFRGDAGARYAEELAKQAAKPTQDAATGLLQTAAANPLAPVAGGAASLLGGAKPWSGGAMLADIQAKPMQLTAAQLEKAAREKALKEFSSLSVDDYLKGLAAGRFKANNALPGFSLEGIITDKTATPEQYFNAIRAAGPEAVDALLRQQYDASLATEASPFGIPQLAIGIGAAGTLAGAVNALGGGNLFGQNPLSGLLNSPNANAVPGLSTGVTTPTGGGLVGAGALNPAGVGLVGGAPLGASPLAVAGGATALPGVSPLPTGGQLPGTNITVGPANNQSWLDNVLQRVRDNVTDPQNIAQRVATNLISGAVTPSASGGEAGGAQMMGGQGYDSRPWPTDIYPGEVQQMPAYLPGLLAALNNRRGLLGG